MNSGKTYLDNEENAFIGLRWPVQCRTVVQRTKTSRKSVKNFEKTLFGPVPRASAGQRALKGS